MCEGLIVVAIILLLGAIGLLWVLRGAGGVLQSYDERDDT